MANILIIDDDAYIRDMLSNRVERMGHIPAAAATLDQGMQILSRGRTNEDPYF